MRNDQDGGKEEPMGRNGLKVEGDRFVPVLLEVTKQMGSAICERRSIEAG